MDNSFQKKKFYLIAHTDCISIGKIECFRQSSSNKLSNLTHTIHN